MWGKCEFRSHRVYPLWEGWETGASTVGGLRGGWGKNWRCVHRCKEVGCRSNTAGLDFLHQTLRTAVSASPYGWTVDLHKTRRSTWCTGISVGAFALFDGLV